MANAAQRPTAKEIVDTIVEAMNKGMEDLGGSYLVPSYYEVLLHPEALESLKTVVPYVIERSRAHLDKQLASLNHRHYSAELGGLKKWFNQNFGRQNEASPMQVSQVYKRTGNSWVIEINPCFDADLPLNYIGVRAELQLQEAVKSPVRQGREREVQQEHGIAPVPRTRRFTVSEDSLPKMPVAPPMMGVFSPRLERVFAVITYRDNEGQHRFEMLQRDLTIGRADASNPEVGLRIHTHSDVSRLHLRIRFNEENQSFMVKDESTFGTHLDGLPIPQKQWIPLNVYAELFLADSVLLTFQAADQR